MYVSASIKIYVGKLLGSLVYESTVVNSSTNSGLRHCSNSRRIPYTVKKERHPILLHFMESARHRVASRIYKQDLFVEENIKENKLQKIHFWKNYQYVIKGNSLFQQFLNVLIFEHYDLKFLVFYLGDILL